MRNTQEYLFSKIRSSFIHAVYGINTNNGQLLTVIQIAKHCMEDPLVVAEALQQLCNEGHVIPRGDLVSKNQPMMYFELGDMWQVNQNESMFGADKNSRGWEKTIADKRVDKHRYFKLQKDSEYVVRDLMREEMHFVNLRTLPPIGPDFINQYLAMDLVKDSKVETNPNEILSPFAKCFEGDAINSYVSTLPVEFGRRHPSLNIYGAEDGFKRTSNIENLEQVSALPSESTNDLFVVKAESQDGESVMDKTRRQFRGW